MVSENVVRMSDREKVIFDLLKKDRVATLERITAAVSAAEGKPAKTGSINNAVKSLMGKTIHLGYMIQRTSTIGRGQKARYRMAQIKLL